MTSGLISSMTAGHDFQTMLDIEQECSFCIRISYKIGILCETQLSAEDRSLDKTGWIEVNGGLNTGFHAFFRIN